MPDWEAARITVIIEDGVGSIHRIDGGTARSVGDGQRVEIPLTRTIDGAELAPTYPIGIRGVELRVIAPLGVAAVGSVRIASLASSEAAGGEDWSTLDFAAGQPGWSWQRVDRDLTTSAVVDQGGSRVLIGSGPGGNDAIFGSPTDPGTIFRLWRRPTVPAALPTVASPQFLDATGSAVGDILTATVRGRRIDLRIVGELVRMPPLAADEGFAVVDRRTLELAVFAATAQTSATDEWWLTVAPGTEAAAIDALSASSLRPEAVVGQSEVASALTSDPVALGVVGALALGSIAALLFATIGYLASATASASERLGEFTILRSLGLSRRQLSLWLALEHVFLLGFGLLMGSALGFLLAWVVLPSATFDATGGAVMPPPVVVVPWAAVAGLALLSIVLLVTTVSIVIRRTAGEAIGDVLRAGEA